MVIGMATTKITITLDDAQVAAMRKLVASKQARSVSGFVKRAVDVALQDAEGWAAMLEQALHETGGPLTAKEKAWADRVLTSHPRRRTRA
jgi:Arc/MetJ-type ribon-helix-helix transcriptional regulator